MQVEANTARAYVTGRGDLLTVRRQVNKNGKAQGKAAEFATTKEITRGGQVARSSRPL